MSRLIYLSTVSETCFFKLAIHSFTIPDPMFDVTCYPWGIIGLNSYTFVGNRFVYCIEYSFRDVLYILVDIVISLYLL